MEAARYVLDNTEYKEITPANVNTGTQVLIQNPTLNHRLKSDEELLKILGEGAAFSLTSANQK